MLAEYLKKHIDGKRVVINLRHNDRTGKILELSPDGDYLVLEDESSFGMGKLARIFLINVRMIEAIEVIQERKAAEVCIPEKNEGAPDDVQVPLP